MIRFVLLLFYNYYFFHLSRIFRILTRSVAFIANYFALVLIFSPPHIYYFREPIVFGRALISVVFQRLLH